MTRSKSVSKLLSLCLITALLWGTACGYKAFLGPGLSVYANESAQVSQPGDLNQDNAIDAVDALLTLQIAVDKFDIESPMLYADVNQDQIVNAEDALWLLRFAVFGSKNPADIFAFVGVEPPQQPPEEQPEIPSTPEQPPESEPALPPEEQPEIPSTPEQPPESEPALPPEEPVDPDHLHGDMVYDYPNFVSESAMVHWLKNGSNAYEDERTAMLQTATNQTITYYRPSPALLQYVSMDWIEVDGIHTMIYRCFFKEDRKEFWVCLANNDRYDYEDSYERIKQHYLDGERGFGLTIVDGIEFYYQFGALDSTSVVWMQYGIAHLALIDGHRDQIETLIPLLKLEQVTVKLNNDHVVQ